MLAGMQPHDVGETFLLDVREHDEWAQVHAPTATHVPMFEVPARIASLPADQPIAVICHVGGRSARVADWLRAQGFDAHNVEGGMDAWQAAGLPVVTP
jgi:rhodanese-related sulfurtransferase